MEYWPDGDITTPGLLYDVKELAPNNNGAYKRVPSGKDIGWSALTTNPAIGAAIVKDSTGTAKLYAGSISRVYQANGTGGWTDRSPATYTASVWDFCQFGDNTIAATGGSHRLQVATTGNFADIAGSPQGAKIVFVHKNAVVALGSSTNGAAWARSVTGDHTNWAAAANNDADSGTLYGGIGGQVTAGCSFQNLAIAWKGAAMYAGVYVGNSDPDSDVIRWEVVSDKYGCVAQWAHVECEAGLVFVSQRDIMLFNGGKPISIADKVRKQFVNEAAAARSSIFCTLDEVNNHVYVWILTSGATRAFIWNYKNGKWGHLTAINADGDLNVGGNAESPVRNANYQDLTSIGGVTTNSAEICNLFFTAGADRITNLCGTTYTGGAGAFLRTGVGGRADADSTLQKVYLVSDATTAISGLTSTVNIYGPGKSGVKTVSSIALSESSHFDVQQTGRFFQVDVTIPSTSGQVSIQDLVPQWATVQRIKGNLGWNG